MSSKYIIKPYCRTCKFAEKSNHLFDRKQVVGKIDGKRRKRWLKPLDIWCLNGGMFRINLNHLRWWGFDRRCPLNPYTHSCEVCGQRMCTEAKMCKSCAKNRMYL